MKYTIPVDKNSACASSTLPISTLNAVIVCRTLNRKKFEKAKKIVSELLKKRISIKGKYYTKTVREISKVLKQLENNAKAKGLEPENMTLYISAHKGPTMHRARRRWRKFGTRLKITHIQAILKG
jgi:ribosomal protein L22